MTEETTRCCGNCKYGVRVDLKQVECYGAPPTPVVLGARPDQLGRMNLQIELMRPRLKVTERACAFWEFQLAQAQDLSRIATKTIGETSQ